MGELPIVYNYTTILVGHIAVQFVEICSYTPVVLERSKLATERVSYTTNEVDERKYLNIYNNVWWIKISPYNASVADLRNNNQEITVPIFVTMEMEYLL